MNESVSIQSASFLEQHELHEIIFVQFRIQNSIQVDRHQIEVILLILCGKCVHRPITRFKEIDSDDACFPAVSTSVLTREGIHESSHTSIGHFKERVSTRKLVRTTQSDVFKNMSHTGIVFGRGLKCNTRQSNDIAMRIARASSLLTSRHCFYVRGRCANVGNRSVYVEA